MTARRRANADEQRIIDRFKRLGPQKRALAVTLRPFVVDGRFDGKVWDHAFGSDEPDVIAQVIAVTGAYQALVNHLVEMLHAAGRLVSLEACRGDTKPPAPRLIDAVREDGGLTAHQADVLKRLYQTRNELQHASLDVQADEVHAAIELLDKTIGRLVTSYVKWLDRYEVRIVPARP